MRIAFDAKRALNNATGLGNYSRILLNALMRDFPEHEYLLFSPHIQDEFFHQLNGAFKMLLPETKFEKIFSALWRSWGLNKQLAKARVDVYHGLSNEIPFSGGRVTKYVVTIHDLIFLKHKEQYPLLDRQIYEVKTRYAAKNADRIIAVSKETKKDLVEFYNIPENKIEVIYQSVDARFQNFAGFNTDELKRKYQLPEKFLLNVGSFFPRKNQKTLIEAFDLIKDKVQEDLVLVGRGAMQKQLEALIERKKLNKRVKLISNVSDNDLPGFYRCASVFIYPSLYEGFGLPVLEALFSEVPVITTKGGAMEEAGGPHSLYVNSLNAEEIATATLSVIQNKSLRENTIRQGLLFAQTMTDQAFAEKTMKVYRSL